MRRKLIKAGDTNNLVGMGYCSTAKRVIPLHLKRLKIPIPEREIPD